MTIAVTGANSSVGLNLLDHVAAAADLDAIAIVRSERAASSLPATPSVTPRITSYDDVDGLAEAMAGASCVVHLAGILIEWPGTTYASANVATAQAVAEAARRAGVQHIVIVSVIGADTSSPNRYLKSKAEAERAVLESGISSTVLRTPILLGPGTAGAASIVRTLGQGRAKLLGGGRYSMRPLDVDDLSQAVIGLCRSRPEGATVHELVGPESMPYREVLARAATTAGTELTFGATPVWMAKLGASVMNRVKGGGISPTVIDVITADEVVEKNADEELGISLTPLSETLRKILPPDRASDMTDIEADAPQARRKPSILQRAVFWGITVACFVYLYFRLRGAADREGVPFGTYLVDVFSDVDWIPWLILMMVYSVLYFMIDTLVTTKALNWFIKEIRFRDIMPIRASAYIISVFNEQIGKGAMAYYLNKRDQVPGWEVGSVMLFIMFCEVFYLLTWATIGFFVTRDSLPEVFGLIPIIAAGAAVFLVLWMMYFGGKILPGNGLRERRILHAFKLAKPWHYGAFFLLRSPALLSAVVVYTIALGLFGVEASFLSLLGYLPVIFFAATVPTPMRAAAITAWVILFPENEGQMAAFGFVQHNFFILFNALIGLLFWRRAQRELFDK